MSNYKDIANFFATRGPEDIERFVDKGLDISQQILAAMKEKGWTQKELAQALGKSDPEVSKWLSGTHNLTLRSITKIEAALDADIIITPLKAEKAYKRIKYITFKVHATTNRVIPEHVSFTETSKNIEQDSSVQIAIASAS
ncbi:MAG: hypothetical protein C7N36_14800 [Bacteroidetes bacterium]|nr:MAG: hypothetical protein C7N36_14800 [Bacteroidota bacterium]